MHIDTITCITMIAGYLDASNTDGVLKDPLVKSDHYNSTTPKWVTKNQ